MGRLSMMKRLAVRRLVGAVFVFALVTACSSRRAEFETDGASTPDDSTRFGSPDDERSCTKCSADLHDVITCGDNPKVIATCPPGQACGPTGCISPCESAAANKTSIGCDYFAIQPDTYPGSCFAAFVTNNWNTDMKVTIGWQGTTIDATPFAYIPSGSGEDLKYEALPDTGIPPNGMAIVFLSVSTDGGQWWAGCPRKAAIEDEQMTPRRETGMGKALEIKTSVPAVVYDVYPYGGAQSMISSATLLLPVSVWDTNYVAATMYGVDDEGTYAGGIDLVAQEDGTEVTLLPTADITATKDVSGAKKNVPVVYKIDRGEYVHVVTDKADLGGSIVQSNKPVGVWGEHTCMLIDAPPRWRIIGAVDATDLVYDPPLEGAPNTLKKRQLIEFDAEGPFHVVSQDDQHPFYLAAHRPGWDCDAAHQQIPPVKALGNEYVAAATDPEAWELGGPETVNIVPPAQFLPSYLFFTDPTYGFTELTVVRRKVNDKFDSVTLDCLGEIDGWKPVGKGKEYEVAHVRLVWEEEAQGKCDNGRHTISSKTPFGVTVWGYDDASSYAYPAGASVKPINNVVVAPSVN